MFIIRTAFWLGIVIMMLPSDKEAQAKMATAAQNGYRQISTLCERHEAACEQGNVMWVSFKGKAQVVGRMAFDMAMERLAPQTEPPAAISAPARISTERAQIGTHGTLRDEDFAPRWRGDAARGRL